MPPNSKRGGHGPGGGAHMSHLFFLLKKQIIRHLFLFFFRKNEQLIVC